MLSQYGSGPYHTELDFLFIGHYYELLHYSTDSFFTGHIISHIDEVKMVLPVNSLLPQEESLVVLEMEGDAPTAPVRQKKVQARGRRAKGRRPIATANKSKGKTAVSLCFLFVTCRSVLCLTLDSYCYGCRHEAHGEQFKSGGIGEHNNGGTS